MTNISEYLDDIVKQCGGFGLFQILLLIILLTAKLSAAWTTLMMSFAGAIPEWWCEQTDSISKNTSDVYKSCIIDNTTKCRSFKYDDSMHTLVNEFDLVCDKDWIVATVTTIQMGGLLVGCFTMGHLSDFVGRKPVLFLSLLMLTVLNLVAYFSVSWQMFAVVRFCLGFFAGTYIIIYFPLATEFVSQNVRPFLTGIPSWVLWAALLGLVAYLLPNWAHLHLATAIFTAPWLLTWWFVPESFRWLVSNKQYDRAEAVVKKMARINKAEVPNLNEIKKITLTEETDNKKYTVLDLFRGKYLIKNTLLHAVMWFTCGYVYYAISFGVQKLSGSLYLNIFLLSAVEIPGNALTIITSNRIGRKWTSCVFFLLSGLAAMLVAIVQTLHLDPELSGKLINGFALTAKLCLGSAWCSLSVLTSEIYPTVVRNIGYGFQNTFTRVGGMVAPQMVYLGQRYTGILYYLSGVLLICSSLSAYFASETRGVVLKDTFETKEVDLNSAKIETAVPSVTRIVSAKYPSEYDKTLSGQDGKFGFINTYL